jgi:hypothetical protein
MADQPDDLDDPEYWRNRAAEVRALVHQVSSLEGKAIILRMAAEYEALADKVEAEAKKQC